MAKFVSRTEDLVVEQLDGGVMVYDTRSHVAHWLDVSAAAVWRACEGGAEEAIIAHATQLDPATCELALERLVGIGLVQTGAAGYSRRTVLRTAAKVGVAGVAAAPIVSAVIPVAAAHASTGSPGGPGGPGGGQQVTYTIQSGPAGAPDGTPDPQNQVSDDGTTYYQALVTSNGAYAVLTGSSYIASAYQYNVQTFQFRSTSPSLIIPAGATNAQISGQFYADNHATAYVNGVAAGTVDQFNSSPGSFQANLTPGATNTLTFDLINDGGPSGLDYVATISYTL